MPTRKSYADHVDLVPYDEFSFFHENQDEWGLARTTPVVARVFFTLPDGRRLSALKWGVGDPAMVLVHGGAQNAHTFDTVALALDLPLLAVDLPGHGHSDPSPYGLSSVEHHADDLQVVFEDALSAPTPLVGMSLGGLVSILTTLRTPNRVSSLTLIDITPGVTNEKARHIHNFVDGPRTFESLDELLERTIAFNPTRSRSSLRRGILHNALQREDGTWVWRHQQHGPATLQGAATRDLWEALGSLAAPVTLIRGMATGSVVDDQDVAELRRRVPSARVHEVADAGHSVQGDQPVKLAELLRAGLVASND